MRTGLPIMTCLLAGSTLPAVAQAPARPADATPVITCTSLANLRTVLRDAQDDVTAAIAAITDPKSDLGCRVLDRKTVTGIADHVALNGLAYDCLSLQNTQVCHWIVAGAATPPTPGPASTQLAPNMPPGKARR